MSGQNAQLKRTLERLFASQPDDQRLRDHLEGVLPDPAFPGLTWYWGPVLYERNRAIFRPLILDRFSDWAASDTKAGTDWKRIEWKSHAKPLEAWLISARTHRDTQLARRLLRWKFAGKDWSVDAKRWCAALVDAYKAAPTKAARAIVLDEFDDWFQLDEATAVALYTVDPGSRIFILKHIPRYYWHMQKRAMWARLGALAQANGDDELYFALYRAMMPLGAWTLEARELARTVTGAEALVAELERRHPVGIEHQHESVMLELLKMRGRDVIPYVRPRLLNVRSGMFGNARAILDLAEANSWWDLWSATLQLSANSQPFNTAVDSLLAKSMKEDDRLARLGMLAGVAREWNWPGVGLARLHPLQDDVAVRLYRRYPSLVRGAFLPHVTPKWGNSCPKLLQAAQEAKDADLVDALASRYATRAEYRFFRSQEARETNEQINTAAALATYYQGIRDKTPDTFARRASNVLTRIPANTIQDYAHLVRTNALARLLFVRSFSAYLGDARAVKDLVEGSNIYVQMLAYRVLSADDPRARTLAVENLDILLGTLLRPVHRKTRLPAFTALANAARADEATARVVLARARDALKLPDKRYPKAELVELIGHILMAHPALCGEAEQPVIYGARAAA